MKNRRLQKIITLFTVLALAWPLPGSAQDEESLNFVRDFLAFRVVPGFGPNPNNVEIFNDYCIDFQEDPSAMGECGRVSPYGIAYEDFLDRLATAYAEGRGGVINFETPILGPPFRDYDKTGYRAFVEQFLLDNPIEAYEAAVRADFPGLNDADVLALASFLQQEDGLEAAEAALLDTSEPKQPVVNRPDRSLEDNRDNAIRESLDTDRIIGLYGPDKDIPLSIGRGPRSYVEGQLATPNFAAPRDLGTMTNGESFPGVGIASYSGSSYRPVSGVQSFNHGMQDMVFDPRDNVTALGLAFLTFGNFQYYQGDSGVPVNPNNMRMWVEFSNGETEELAQTSRQESGNWDVFFAVEAPEGESITRVWCRVVGRNWRTFVSLDDIAFITEPALAYVASATAFTGAGGAEFYEILQTGQNAQSVSIDGLPPGISFNPETRLLSGTFEAAGTYTATVTLTNAVGTNTEEIVFVVEPPVDPSLYLEIDPVGDANVVLRRDLVPVVIGTNLDETLPAGSISFFSRVYKLDEEGNREPSSLDFLGLTLRDNTLFGRPGSAEQIGTYEVEVFARTALSSDRTRFQLSVLPPTVSPNFDSNKTTDFALRSGGSLFRADNPAETGSFGTVSMEPVLSGIPGNADVFTGDFNGDNQTDILVWDPGAGSVRQFLSRGPDGGFEDSLLLDGIDTSDGETLVAVHDYNGDGTTDLFWRNDSRQRLSFWLMRDGRIAWAGILEAADYPGELVLASDFSGSGAFMHLYRDGAGVYTLQRFDLFTGLGSVQASSLSFTVDPDLEPVLSADFTNDGKQDILWQNPLTGEAFFWEMDGLSTNRPFFPEPETGEDGEPLPLEEPVSASAGTPLLPSGFDWDVVTAADFNNDQYADLVLRNRSSGSLGVLNLSGNRSRGFIRVIGGAGEDLVMAGDFDGDARNDFLLRDRDGEDLTIVSIDADGGLGRTGYGTAPASPEWLTSLRVDNTAAPIGTGFEWLGDYSFIDNAWFRIAPWGYLAPVSVNAAEQSGWFMDPALGYLWISSGYYPNIFQARNGFWLRYVEGTAPPRWFYNHIFGFYMTENEL